MNKDLPSHRASREKVRSVMGCDNPDPVPLYMPAIYEHKAWFIDDTPSNVSRDTDLFEKAVITEFEQIGPDALTIGIDVYNLEAEAAGCSVKFYEGDDTSIPGIRPGDHIIKLGDDVVNRRVPNPLSDGRMPINIEVARRVVAELGDEVWIRGAVSGPFSLAISLMGAEDLFLTTLDDPKFVHELLAYAGRIIKTFGEAYMDVGADVIVFDSQASPDLLSPQMYADYVTPVMQDLNRHFAELGVAHVPLIIGGNTTRLIDALLSTGANNLLCDFTADWPTWLEKCRSENRALRRNLDPAFIQKSDPDQIHNVAKSVVEEGEGYGGFIVGTAVVPYGTPTANLLAVKQACVEA